MSAQKMTYFRTRMRDLGNEYKGKDKAALIAAAGCCQMPDCARKPGDEYIFGPTHYLKRRLRFRVKLQVHVVDGAAIGFNRVVLCDGCHSSYHLFNRLDEEASFGKTLAETTYERCKTCNELTCRCCPECKRSPRWCRCAAKKAAAEDKDKKEESSCKKKRGKRNITRRKICRAAGSKSRRKGRTARCTRSTGRIGTSSKPLTSAERMAIVVRKPRSNGCAASGTLTSSSGRSRS